MINTAENRHLWRKSLSHQYQTIRSLSEQLCKPLAIEDYLLQAIPEVSPAKWHLAHTSWFFETFLLEPYAKNFKPYDSQYAYLFNSYYNGVGTPYPRARRGLISRPNVEQIYAYRKNIDDQVLNLIENIDEQHFETLSFIITLGLNHEQQHQELLLTDCKYNFSINPKKPAYLIDGQYSTSKHLPLDYISVSGGLVDIGSQGTEFVFDNEMPVHKFHINDFMLTNRTISNQEYLEFIKDGGYQRSDLWLADAWTHLNQQQWTAPLYWQQQDKQWFEYTLFGLQELDLAAPVTHVSYFEADAYATWAGARLPSEQEWEYTAKQKPLKHLYKTGNFLESNRYHPRFEPQDSVEQANASAFSQLFGNVWEWTQSPYTAYPGFQAYNGLIGEYNGKFMCNQWVLRGGSCITPRNHIRTSYRNFFYPHERWQFTGIRLAKNI